MIYTPDEKQSMDLLLSAFSDHIAQHCYHDIAYSDKSGFLLLTIGEGADNLYFPISGFEEMLTIFIDDFLLEEETRVGHYLHLDYDRVQRLLLSRLEPCGFDRNFLLKTIGQCFDSHQRECEQMWKKYQEEQQQPLYILSPGNTWK